MLNDEIAATLLRIEVSHEKGRSLETDDQYTGVRRWSDARQRRSGGRGPQAGVRTRRMGEAAFRRRRGGNEVRPRGLLGGRRVFVRPTDIRTLCRLLGSNGEFGQPLC